MTGMSDQEAHDFYADPAHLKIAGPGRKHPKDELTEHMSFRISPSMRGQVTGAAASEGRAADSWVRRALRNELQRRGAAERPEGLIEGSGRRGEPKPLPSSLQSRHRTFSCPHFSIAHVDSSTCMTCGPLTATEET